MTRTVPKPKKSASGKKRSRTAARRSKQRASAGTARSRSRAPTSSATRTVATSTSANGQSEPVKAGSSQAGTAERYAAFVEAYVTNGGNATQAAITAGYSPKSAYAQGSRLLNHVQVQAALESRQKELREKHQLTTDRVLKELARLAYFDIRKLYDEKGELKAVHQLDDDTAAAIASMDLEGGKIVKVRGADKNSAIEKAARILGLFKPDVPLIPPAPPAPGPGGMTLNVNATLKPSEALLRLLGRAGGANGGR
jgi:phage terminase small subunit